MSYTIVRYYGERRGSRCGYCRTSNSSSHGMHAFSMTPYDYQDLIDRGWRRCGLYCYKPKNHETCCPSYSIRCDVNEFKLSKSQKKILRRMRKFLVDGVRGGMETESIEHDLIGGPPQELAIEQPVQPVALPEINFDYNKIAPLPQVEGDIDNHVLPEKSEVDTQAEARPNSKGPKKKAKLLRLERRNQKLAAKGIPTTVDQKSKKQKNTEKTLTDFLDYEEESCLHKLKICLIPSNEGLSEPVVELYRKYKVAVFKDPPEKITKESFERFLVRSPIKVKLVNVNSQAFSESCDQSYELYKKYQVIIHNDPVENLEDFLLFLVKSPMKWTNDDIEPEEGFGTYHQQYWLNDKLIAVGVLDILPYCVSSVYFFYDPDYSFLSLGTYGSLKEIALTRELFVKYPKLRYYYMGFYIPTCPKMTYKGRLSSSYLLCPEVYTWHLLTDDVRELLNEQKYSRLNKDLPREDAETFTIEDLKHVLIYVNSRCVKTVEEISKRHKNSLDLDLIKEYGNLVGKTCARRMIYAPD